MTDKQFQAKRKSGEYSELGRYFWNTFLLPPKSSKKRQRAEKQFDSLTKREQAKLEEEEL